MNYKNYLSLFLIILALSAQSQTTAEVQVIHNSADAAASTVDIYTQLDPNNPFLDDVDFRTASGFETVPSGTSIEVGIAPGNSTDADDTLKAFNLGPLTANEKYVVVANGIVSSANYNPAPPLTLDVYPMAQSAANNPGNTDVLVAHGSTDAPTVKVTDVTNPVNTADITPNVSYGDFAGYVGLPTNDYNIQIRTPNETTVEEYQAPLSSLGLGGDAIVVVASGFLDTAANNNGPEFGLWAATPSGGPLVQLPVVNTPTTARVQFIHNCAATDASVVDVYANGNLAIDDWNFRTASAFIDLPAGVAINFDVAGPSSTNNNNPLYSQSVTFTGGEKYYAIASGTIGSGTYNPAEPFEIKAIAGAQEAAINAGEVDIMAFHGATDAPVVDIEETGVGAGTLFSGLTYGDNSNYVNVAENDYELTVSSQGNFVASYAAPLQTLGLADSAMLVLASGFLDTAANNNGPEFGLWAALPSGGQLVELPLITAAGIDKESQVDFELYPNPVKNQLNVQFDQGNKFNTYQIVDMSGKIIAKGSQNSSINNVDISSLSKGTYFITFINEENITTQKFIKQ